MSGQGGEQLTDFERLSRQALEESVLRIDGRVRSRLNQARQAAVEAASARRRPLFSRFFTLVPTAGAAAAAVLVAMVLWHRGPQVELPAVTESQHAGGSGSSGGRRSARPGAGRRRLRLVLRVGGRTDGGGRRRERKPDVESALPAGAGLCGTHGRLRCRARRRSAAEAHAPGSSTTSCWSSWVASIPPSDTVQPDDGSWIEYLSQTDIGKVAKPGNPTVVAAKPATPAPKPSAPGAKQDE